METGFGSPYISGADPGEWGFGSPEPVGGADTYPENTGFGSPYLFLLPEQLQILGQFDEFGDDGGYLVEVLGDYPYLGPYRFRLIDAGGNEYPETTFCYSGVPTQGFNCYTLTGGVDVVLFTLPPAPPGVYDLQVEYGENFGQVALKSQAITINTRNRSRQVYALRRRIPKHYKTGPIVSRMDQLLP